MEHARYHLIFEGFKPGINKTAVSFTLKDQMALKDSQLADMMAGRPTVLRQNLDKAAAMRLGKELSQTGLVVKAKALAAHQKNSPEAVRKHLLNGGLDQYFASRYRHADEDLDTILRLVLLAAFAFGTYLILPIIGLTVLVPVISATVWATQPMAALIQTLFAILLFAPAVFLFPKPKAPEGLELDRETEEFLFALIDNVAEHLSAPKIKRVFLVENPIATFRQTPQQWVTNTADLEIGLPVLEMLNMQQFVGLLAMRMTPLSSALHARTWGLFSQWYNALRIKQKRWALLLSNWVHPIRDHQQKRGFTITRDLVGFKIAQQLQKLDKRFDQLNRDWPEFVDYCERLRLRGNNWQNLIGKLDKVDDQASDLEALFRIESPALWLLSTADGYQKMFQKEQSTDNVAMSGLKLWQQFQTYLPLLEQFQTRLLRPEALYPPVGSTRTKRHNNALLVNRRASAVVNAQLQHIERRLGLQEKPKKEKDINVLLQKWRDSSAGLWPQQAHESTKLPLLKALFNAMQTLQQMAAWSSVTSRLNGVQLKQQRQQLKILKQKWQTQCDLLPALPLLGNGKKLTEQLAHNNAEYSIEASLVHWQAVISTYWVYVAGQVLMERQDEEDD